MGTILRRTLLIGSAAIVGGVAFGVWRYNQDYPNPLEDSLAEGESTFNPYIKVTADGGVTVMIPRSEMGQGVTTTLTALVAEELDMEVAQLGVEIAPASFAYYNSAMLADGAPLANWNRGLVAQMMRSGMGAMGRVLGIQATGGSSSIVDAYERVREAGAVARATILAAAAEAHDVSPASLKTQKGQVVLPDGKRVPYAELAVAAASREPVAARSKPSSDWKVLGRSQPRTDMAAKVTGAPIFGIDVDLPDMVHATVRMNPRLGGPMVSFDASAAKAMPGVIDVIDMSGPQNEAYGGGFAVIAKDTWSAFQAADAVEVEWGPAPYPETSAAMQAVLDETLKQGSGAGDGLRDDGDVDTAFADAPRDRVVEATYRVPHLAHATMEPMNATAQLKDGRLDVWCGNQMPTILRADCAAEAGVEVERTFVHTTYLGGGFGRRGEVDFARFATRVARHPSVAGRAVKVTWTREEDMTHDTYRPAAASRWRARLGDDGLPVAIDAAIACPSIMASAMGRMFPSLTPAGPDNTITHGAFDQPYRVADYRVSGLKAPIAVPIGFWRSVGNSYNGFFHECFLDEIAAKSGLDPMEMRLKLMEPWPVAVGVMRKVAQMSGWGTDAPDRAKGCAFTLSFGTWTAQVVEVEKTDDGVRITNVWCAADPGRVLDPAIFKAQLQSGIVFGLSSAVDEAITFADGRVEQENYDTFDALRMDRTPAIHVELLENADHMGGAGEPGTPPAIPALANAIFALTGKRVRELPISNEVEFA